MITLVDNTAVNHGGLSARLMLGILCAYILDQGLIMLRSYLGRKNLAQHTLADERFLIWSSMNGKKAEYKVMILN